MIFFVNKWLPNENVGHSDQIFDVLKLDADVHICTKY